MIIKEVNLIIYKWEKVNQMKKIKKKLKMAQY